MSVSQKTVEVHHDLLADARCRAEAFRADCTGRGTLVVNLISSPGAGKTSLLEATARLLAGRRRLAVLVGDIATDRDAQRLAPLVPVVQLTTGGACHLEFPLVERGLRQLGPVDADILFIENVGNLVCPASHDLGEHLRVILLSTTEGDDKPAKYPKAFRTSQALVISKTDLLAYVPFSVHRASVDAHQVQPDLTVLPLSALSGVGMAQWCEFLERKHAELLKPQHG